jgi:hypothetical protein
MLAAGKKFYDALRRVVAEESPVGLHQLNTDVWELL